MILILILLQFFTNLEPVGRGVEPVGRGVEPMANIHMNAGS